MTSSQEIFLAVLFVVVVGLVSIAAWIFRPNRSQERLRKLIHETQDSQQENDQSRWLEVMAELARPLSKLAAPEEGFEESSVKLKFVHAGIRGSSAPMTFFGIKAGLTIGLPLIGLIILSLAGSTMGGNKLLMILLSLAAVGYYAPNWVLNNMVASRQLEIFENFPDALDLMTVCVEAGLGTEAAIYRVSEDLAFKSPVLSEEMRLVNLELRAGSDRERALRNLAFRTGVDEVDNFVTMIIQAERFGTSIAASLRIQADMLRTRRRQKAEETAAKIPLKLLFPLMVCIFPALMVVLIGPAIIQIYRGMLPMMGG